jgi:hypothetical protein
MEQMKPLPVPEVPGNTEAERMDNAVRMLFSASKEAFVKQETKHKRARDRKKRAKKAA